MGWTIQDSTKSMSYSYNAVGSLADELAYATTSADWRILQPVFRRHSGDPFHVNPDQAARIADILSAAADNRLMPADGAEMARRLADSARAAADDGTTWDWS